VLDGKLALVTGGGRGIGRSIVLELASRGADVIVTYFRNRDAAERTAAEAKALGVRTHVLRGHVGDEERLARLFEEVRERFGYLDILVNNAASGVNRSIQELTAHQWDWTVNINARGAWLCANHAAELMTGRKGRIINISSLGSGRVLREYFAVGVSKAALEAVTRYLAVELAPRGIAVNAVSGGLVETDALKAFSGGQELIDDMTRRTPAGRMVEPADFARVVSFLCTDAAEMIRGQTIIVDGGLSLLI